MLITVQLVIEYRFWFSYRKKWIYPRSGIRSDHPFPLLWPSIYPSLSKEGQSSKHPAKKEPKPDGFHANKTYFPEHSISVFSVSIRGRRDELFLIMCHSYNYFH